MVSSRYLSLGLMFLGAAQVACNGTETPMTNDGGKDGPGVLDASVASVLVGPAGGTFTLAGGKVKLEVSPGALAKETSIKAVATKSYPKDAHVVEGTVFDLLPDGIVFNKPVKLSISYEQSKVPPATAEGSLRILKVVVGAWKSVNGGGVDTKAAVAWAHIDGFSKYGIKGRSPVTPDGIADMAADAAAPPDSSLVDAPQADAPTPDAPQPDVLKVDTQKPDVMKPDTLVPDAVVPDASKPPAKTCPGFVSKAGWCWHRPLPQGNTLFDVGCAGNKVFIAGKDGTVLVRDGKKWKPVSLGTKTELRVVWGASASDMYIGGGSIFHNNGVNWSQQTLPKPTGLVHGIWGNGSGSVWAVGSDGTMWHRQGTTWTSLSTNTTKDLQGIWATGNKMYAVGESGVIFHDKWLKTQVNASSLLGVWGSSAKDVYAVGWNATSGMVLHFDGAKWSHQASGKTKVLRDVWGAGSTTVYAVGGEAIIHNDGTGWKKQYSEIGRSLFGVGGCSASDVYAVGGGGVILHSDGTKWVEQSSSTKFMHINDVWGASSTDIFAVGGGEGVSYILHYDGSGWKEQFSTPGGGLSGVWGTSGTNVYAVGSRSGEGIVLRYDGKQWKEIHVAKGVSSLTDVWALSNKSVFVVGSQGAILRYNGSQWIKLASGTTKTLLSVWGTSGNNVVAGGWNGTLIRFDGSSWKQQGLSGPSTSFDTVHDVWGTSSTNVFAVGAKGVFQFDGSMWKTISTTKNSSNYGVRGDGKSGIFVVGSAGKAMHYDGSTWKTLDSGTHHGFNAIWAGASKVFAVGDSGTILEYQGKTKP